MNEDIRQRVEDLRKRIRRHEWLYYVKGEPEISDSEFDALMNELRKLEEENPELITPDSPTQRVGGAAASFETARHRVPMMSLDNVYTAEDISNWLNRMHKSVGDRVFPIVAELKIDGVSISLTYQNGNLVSALTRGDGETGDVVTANVRTIKSVPLTIESEFDMDVRGEVWLPRSRLAALNRERLASGEELFKNCRNLAAGSLKNLDPAVTAERGLQATVYDIAQAAELGLGAHWNTLEFLREQGFRVNEPVKLCVSMQDILEYINEADRLRKELDFDTDGVVLKIDDLAVRRELGATAKAPRWAVAYKFPQEQAVTTLNSVIWQVGRRQLTPVAILEPVELGGTTVSRASLHNLDQIREKDIRVKDKVIVEKAGFIIPYVVAVKKEERTGREIPIEPPETCPACGRSLYIGFESDGGGETTVVRCTNQTCQGTLARRIIHFVTMMEMENIGPQLIEKLIAAELLGEAADLFRLRKEDLLNVDRMGEKLADKILNNIEQARKRPLSKLIAALGIPNVGPVVSEELAGHFGSLSAFRKADYEELLSVPGIGEKMARDISSFLANSENQALLDRLAEWWRGPSEPESASIPQTLKGLTFVLTGEASVPRPKLEELIKKHGGRCAGSVSSKTDYLVIGSKEPPDYSSSKKSKAESLGVPIIDEYKLIAMAEGKPSWSADK